MSLFDIVESSELNYQTYLETGTNEKGEEYLTFKTNGIYVAFSCSQKFIAVEFETNFK